MTPEGKVKVKINKLLDGYGSLVYRFMPVQYGYGQATVDYLLCVNGAFVAVEAKPDGKKATSRQEGTLERIEAARGATFVVNDDATLGALKEFLDMIVVDTAE